MDLSIPDILDELKKNGFPIYTIRSEKLAEGNIIEWSNFIWFLLSKNMVHDDCLKWVNKVCGINLETYDNAFNHQKKVLIDLLSKIY